MMSNGLSVTQIIWAFGLASMFAQWPIVSKATGVHGFWVAVLVLVGSAIGGIIPSATRLNEFPTPSIVLGLVVIAAGVVNGAAMYFYPVMVGDPTIPTASFITAVIAAMIIMSIVFTAIAEQTLPSPQLILGALVILGGLYITTL